MLGQEAPAQGGQNWVKDTTTANFRQDVISESARQPVLVDFWAPWCGPCKQLTPVLEKTVAAAAGKVRLVKMNIDEHPEIAGQLGVQSIPAVFAFQNGQPVDGFMGALPEGQVKAFIERLVGPLKSEIDDMIDAAEEALALGDVDAALELFAKAEAAQPANVKAAAGLIQVLVQKAELEQAREVLARQSDKALADQAVQAARAALDIAEQSLNAGDVGDLVKRLDKDPNDHQARFDLAIALNAQSKRDEASDALVEIIKRNRSWNDDAARKQLLQFFEGWGPMDADTIAGRRKLSTVLFS